MKKRNLVIVAFMLVAAMTIGVGYAALSVELTVNGTASVNSVAAQEEFTEDVYFSEAKRLDGNGTRVEDADGNTIEDSIEITNNNHTVTFAVKTLMGVNEYVKYTFTVKNESTMAATVAPTINITENTNSAYEVVVTEITNGSALTTGTTDGNSFELNPTNGEKTFEVTITLKTMPTGENETFNLGLKITLNAQIDN